MDAHGITVDSIATTGPGHAGEIARRAVDRGADLILVAGGDGTINEAVNGMVNSDVPLGILPAGTANVLANELGIGRTMEHAASVLADSVKERVALGLISGETEDSRRHFLLMAGAGLDADIVYHLNQRMKEAFGKVAYWIGGFSKLGRRIPEFTVRAEGRSIVPALRCSAGSATMAAIWKSRPPFRYWMTSSRWCCLKARVRSDF